MKPNGILFLLLLGSPFLAFAHSGDTLQCNFPQGTPTLYTSGNGGYTCGTSGNGDVAFAQKYGVAAAISACTAQSNSSVSKVLVWFGAKLVSSGIDSVKVKIYDVTASGAPGQLLSTSFPFSYNFIDTSGSNNMVTTTFLMQTPVTLTDSFFVSVEIPGTGDDTLGIISTTHGNAAGSQLAWVKDSTGSWQPLNVARSLDVDLAIFPMVVDPHDSNPGPVLPSGALFIQPNPSADFAELRFRILDSLATVNVVIVDLTGKLVRNLTFEAIEGINKLTVDLKGMAAGTYICTVYEKEISYYNKLVVLKKPD